MTSYDDLGDAGLAQLDVLDHQRLPDRRQDCSAHGHTI
jgi:hypothetical protein